MSDPLDWLLWFFLDVLAVGAIVDVWFNGSLFARWRAWQETSSHWFGRLVSCDFCLSHHVPWLLIVLVAAGQAWLPAPWSAVGQYVIFTLAVTRGAWLLNGWLPEHLQYRGLRIPPPHEHFLDSPPGTD